MENVLTIVVLAVVVLALISNVIRSSRVTKELIINTITKTMKQYTDPIIKYTKEKINEFSEFTEEHEFSYFQQIVYDEVYEWEKEKIKSNLKDGNLLDQLVLKYIDNPLFKEEIYNILIKILDDNGISELLAMRYNYLSDLLKETLEKAENK